MGIVDPHRNYPRSVRRTPSNSRLDLLQAAVFVLGQGEPPSCRQRIRTGESHRTSVTIRLRGCECDNMGALRTLVKSGADTGGSHRINGETNTLSSLQQSTGENRSDYRNSLYICVCVYARPVCVYQKICEHSRIGDRRSSDAGTDRLRHGALNNETLRWNR